MTTRRNKRDNIITGTVRTNRVGSECTFEICLVEDWALMTEGERNDALIEAMWGSGLVDVFPNL
jgi:hypothetical protein